MTNELPIAKSGLIVSGLTACLVAAALLPGCSSPAEAKLGEYLEELELNTPLESVKEIEIGSYRFASAARYQDPSGREAEPMWVRIKFKLYAIAAPEDESAILGACGQHRGMLDDAILTICRNASIDELNDNRWATLKSRLIDTVRPLLGKDRVRQLTFGEFSWEPI